MKARGATPETGRPLSCVVLQSPAAIPATCVACSELTGSNGREAYFQDSPGGGNARATITFAVVKALFPLGKPLGIVKPAGLKKACAWSTPSSMIPILIP